MKHWVREWLRDTVVLADRLAPHEDSERRLCGTRRGAWMFQYGVPPARVPRISTCRENGGSDNRFRRVQRNTFITVVVETANLLAMCILRQRLELRAAVQLRARHSVCFVGACGVVCAVWASAVWCKEDRDGDKGARHTAGQGEVDKQDAEEGILVTVPSVPYVPQYLGRYVCTWYAPIGGTMNHLQDCPRDMKSVEDLLEDRDLRCRVWCTALE